MKKKKVKILSITARIGKGFLLRLILWIWSIAVLFPLIWIIFSSFKNNMEFFKSPWTLPSALRFDNYINAWSASNVSGYFLNSLFIVVGTLILTLTFVTTSAYIFAKYDYRGIRIVQRAFFILMMVPGVLILIPQYFMALSLNMTDNLITLILLYSLGNTPFYAFMLAPFIRGVHNSFFEAAKVDGASEFRIFFYIVIPMIKPSIFVISLLSIMGSWNEFVMALTMIREKSMYPVSVGIHYLANASQYSVDYVRLMAGLVLVMVPILILYGIFQKPLQEGMSAGEGVKG
jgi:ABC-type sugar transport system, permease component